MYIWDLPDWPIFKWDTGGLADLLIRTHHEQGRLIGRMEGLGFDLRDEARLQILTQDVMKSSEIEGENLDAEAVRSSIARKLGLDVGGLKASDRHVDGMVEIVLDATTKFEQPLTSDRLFSWHAALFPTGWSGLVRIETGNWRTADSGPMQVVSGALGREVVHYEAPPANRIEFYIKRFLEWFEAEEFTDPIIKAGLAHLWFVTIHPFEDGNGRIGRAVLDMLLARSENNAQRFYSMSKQIESERNDYYRVLERTQRGSMDVTEYLEWYLGCLLRSFNAAREVLAGVLQKARFWERFAMEPLNGRQIKVVNRLLDGLEGKLTSSKWAKMAKCSQDTAYRDITDLIERQILVKNTAGGRSTSYSLVDL